MVLRPDVRRGQLSSAAGGGACGLRTSGRKSGLGLEKRLSTSTGTAEEESVTDLGCSVRMLEITSSGLYFFFSILASLAMSYASNCRRRSKSILPLDWSWTRYSPGAGKRTS